MRKVLWTESGEITAFLALLLVALLSFVFSILEVATVVGGKAYLSLVSRMSGDSLMSEFSWPLFNDYGLLAVDAGYGKAYKRDSESLNKLKNSIKVSIEEKKGGLLGGTLVSVSIEETEGLIDGNYCFANQVREQTILDGVQTLLESFMGGQKAVGASALPQIYEAQKKAMEKVAVVTADLLKAMEIADGVRMSETGFVEGADGALVGANRFVKMFGVGDREKMKATYGDSRVYALAEDKILYHKEDVTAIRKKVEELLKPSEKSEEGEEEEKEKEEEKEEEEEKEKEGKSESDENEAEKAENETVKRDEELAKAEEEIGGVFSVITAQIEITDLLILRLEEILLKQELAANYLDEYERELKSVPGITSELLDGLIQEALEFRDYASLKNCGTDIKAMLEEEGKNRLLLTAVLPFLGKENSLESKYMGLVLLEEGFSEISYEKLKFNYAGLTYGENKGDDMKEVISSIAGKGLFKLLGLREVSDCELTGLDLPSEESKREFMTELWELFSETLKVFSESGIQGTMLEVGKKLSDDALLELYCTRHFGDFLEPKPYSVLDYEREYILFGHKRDSDNLLETCSRLIALRAVSNYLSIMSDGKRMAAASSAAISTVGWFAPEFYVPVKYVLITAWAIEEGVVDTAALLAGKKLLLYPITGRIYLGELLMLSPSLVKMKVSEIPTLSTGIGYEDYITFLSFFGFNRNKELRTMDLIQENIRLRYNDSFRIKNCITGITYKADAVVKKNFKIPYIKEDFYDVSVKTTASYSGR